MAPGQRAVEAIRQNPEKSDRAIAAEIGVDQKTVWKARKATEDNSSVEHNSATFRKGTDGKVRRMPIRKTDLSDATRQAMASAVLDEGKSLEQAAAAFAPGHSVEVAKDAVKREEYA